MLTLRTNTYEYDLALSTEYRRFDYHVQGRTRVDGVGYIRSKHVESALTPLAFNNIGVWHLTICGDTLNEIAPHIQSFKNEYASISNDRFGILRIYTPQVDEVYNSLDPDLFSTPISAIQDLYNKCMEQVRLREAVGRTLTTKVKLVKGKRIVVLISNYSDDTQASDLFLTLGLFPVFNQDIKDRFNEEELEYFKVLVNRSQVKRISNVKATEAFQAAVHTNKYAEVLKEIQMNQAIESIVNNNINAARSTVTNAENNAERLLRDYQELKQQFFRATEELQRLTENKEAAIEEIKSALKIDGIQRVDIESNTLAITFVTPVSFFNVDEVECVVNRMRDDWVKQLFTDVFLEQKYKLNIYSRYLYQLGNRNQRFMPPSAVPFEYLIQHKAMYNPHTHFFQCLGDYRPQLIDAEAKQDLLLFNNIALASTRSINFRDGTVINRWIEDLRSIPSSTNWTKQTLLETDVLIDADGNGHSLREIYLQPVGDIDVQEA